MIRYCACGASSRDKRFHPTRKQCQDCADRREQARAERLSILHPTPIVAVPEREPDHRDTYGRIRAPRHLLWVPKAFPVCCIPGCTMCRVIHPHHLTIAQPKMMKVKAGDNFVCNLGDWHHERLHDKRGDERAFWIENKVNPFVLCREIWLASPYGERAIPTTAADWLIVASSAEMFPFQPTRQVAA